MDESAAKRRPVTTTIETIGRLVSTPLEFIGGLVWLLRDLLRWVLRSIFSRRIRFGKSAFVSQMVRVGVRSISIVVLVSGSIGLILALQTAPSLAQFGQVDKVAKLCFDSLTNSTARAMLESIDKRRAKHLPVAAMLLQEILATGRLEGVTISSAGLREGVLRDALGAPSHDPLMDGAIAFARLDKNQILFGEALHEFIAPALAPEPDLFGSPAADARIEKTACMMADSAGRFHPGSPVYHGV